MKTILVRGDSGFAVPELYELCEEMNVKYIFRLKKNARLNRLGAALQVCNPNTDITKPEYQYSVTTYRANTWTKERDIVTLQVRRPNEFIFDSMYIVTNLDLKHITPETVVKMYKKRGLMENFIKEAKAGFAFDKTDSSKFTANAFRMMMSVLAYNVISMMKNCILPVEMRSWTISTIRTHLIKIAGKLVHHARKTTLKLDSSSVFKESYFKIGRLIMDFEMKLA
jgi:hypothetical protein